MIDGLIEQIETALRRSVPAATVLFALLIDALPVPSASPEAVAPSFLIIVFYFWVIYRPTLMPPLVIFALGLTADVMTGGPFGLSALLLLLLRRFLLTPDNTLLTKSFAVLWVGFAVTALVAIGLRWLLASLWWLRPFPLEPSMIEVVLTIVAFPPLAWMLGQVNLLVLGRRHASGG